MGVVSHLRLSIPTSHRRNQRFGNRLDPARLSESQAISTAGQFPFPARASTRNREARPLCWRSHHGGGHALAGPQVFSGKPPLDRPELMIGELSAFREESATPSTRGPACPTSANPSDATVLSLPTC